MGNLSDREVKAATSSKYDGDNLSLNVKPSGSKAWQFKYTFRGERLTIGLGAYPVVALKDARKKAEPLRKLLADGVDPKTHLAAEATKASIAAAKVISFDQARELFCKTDRVSGWTKKHAGSWHARLQTYASPLFGDTPVADVDERMVHQALDAVQGMSETMHRLQEGIRMVLSFAIARKYRAGPNPAVWADNLEHAGYKPRDRDKHHASLPYAMLPAFLADLREHDCDGARALEFTILTGVRAAECTKALWSEFDLSKRLWTIPGERMKEGKEHRVPLSAAALAVLKTMEGKHARFVFAGKDTGEPMTTQAMLELVKRERKRMGVKFTVHGFRSTFKKWAVEQTNYSDDVSEAALAHVFGSKVRRDYADRAERFEQRRMLMNDWAAYCNGEKARGKVLQFPA